MISDQDHIFCCFTFDCTTSPLIFIMCLTEVCLVLGVPIKEEFRSNNNTLTERFYFVKIKRSKGLNIIIFLT